MIDEHELVRKLNNEMISPVFDNNDYHFNLGIKRALEIIYRMPEGRKNPWERGEEYD